MANGDLNFSVSTEELDSKGTDIDNIFKDIEEALQEIEEAKKGIASWQSQNKDKYEARINKALPKMHEMAEVIASYGGVAHHASRRLSDVEQKISRAMEQTDLNN